MNQTALTENPAELGIIGSAALPSLVDMELHRRRMIGFFATQMQLSVDYGVIPTVKKPFLFKPGAEKIARLFQLYPRCTLAREISDEKQQMIEFTYTCEIWAQRQTPDLSKWQDVLVTKWESSANSREKSFHKWVENQRVIRTWAEMLEQRSNIRERSEKRCFVMGVRVGAGCSGMFEADDMEKQLATTDAEQDAERAKSLKQIKEVARKMPTNEWWNLTKAVLGEYRVNKLKDLPNPWGSLTVYEINAILLAKEGGLDNPKTAENLKQESASVSPSDAPPCGECGKELGEKNAMDAERGVVCIPCFTKLQKADGQQTLV